MPPHVVVQHLAKRYGAVEAVRDASFTIGRGEVFGLLGPNGAGKTTTLECLVGLREPDAGELSVGGVDVRRHAREARQRIGVALQSTALPDHLTPREALALFGGFYRERVAPAELIERFSLGEKADANFATLSGGQKQRLALALAFVNRPELVVLDEPAAGLDPQARRELHAEIGRMRRDGHTVLLSTHDLAEAEALCDRVAIIDRGRIAAEGAPRELVLRARARQSVALVTTPALADERLARLPGVDGLARDGDRVKLSTTDATATLAALTLALAETRVDLVELTVRKASLEEVFLGLTGAAR